MSEAVWAVLCPGVSYTRQCTQFIAESEQNIYKQNYQCGCRHVGRRRSLCCEGVCHCHHVVHWTPPPLPPLCGHCCHVTCRAPHSLPPLHVLHLLPADRYPTFPSFLLPPPPLPPFRTGSFSSDSLSLSVTDMLIAEIVCMCSVHACAK